MADHRARVLLEEEERARNRQLQLEIQRSNMNPPDMRIRAWEKVHALCLPAIDTHPILIVIANDTGLTLKDVQEVQLARRAASPATAAARGATETPFRLLDRP
jgi:hypothetical protein